MGPVQTINISSQRNYFMISYTLYYYIYASVIKNNNKKAELELLWTGQFIYVFEL